MLLRKKKNSTTTTGRLGEDLAARYLLDQGYIVVERNYRKRFGEVDIIAREKQTLVFIEVKTRQSQQYGSPFEAVDSRKQRQLTKIALDYLLTHRHDGGEARFDVIAVVLDKQQTLVTIDHLKNAFDCCE